MSTQFRSPLSLRKAKGLAFLYLFLYIGQLTLWAQSQQNPIEVPSAISFGTVYMGEEANAAFEIKNISQNKITGLSLRTSCGCTTAQLEKRELNPGESVPVEVKVKTMGKMGGLRKRIAISANQIRRPVLVYVEGMIKAQEQPHKMVKGESIFSQSCAACHVNPGRSLSGYRLYLADCAMCHGIFKEGLSAPPLSPLIIKLKGDEAILKTIEKGGPLNMPGFSKKHGGPLDGAQIESLMKFLKSFPKGEKGHGLQAPSPPSAYKGIARGAYFYRHLCMPCHGASRKGPIGPDISYQALKKYSHDDLKNILVEGIEDAPLMKSWLKDQGGLLSNEDIDDIVDYLKGKKRSQVK